MIFFHIKYEKILNIHEDTRSRSPSISIANDPDFDKYGDLNMEHDDDDEVPAYTTRRSRTTLPKGRPFHRRTPFAKKKGKKIVNR